MSAIPDSLRMLNVRKPIEFHSSQISTPAPLWSYDMWMLGCLIWELYAGSELTRIEDIKQTKEIPKKLLPQYQAIFSSNPATRPVGERVLSSSYFESGYVQACLFFQNVQLKDSAEKDYFLSYALCFSMCDVAC